MGKRKRSSKNIIRIFFINLIKLFVLLIVTPPIAFVVAIIVLDYNPLANKMAAYARVSQMSDWELPPQSEFITLETVEKNDEIGCWLTGTLSLSSQLSEGEITTFYETTHFETYKYSFRDFVIQPNLYDENGNSLYHVTATRFWQC